MTVLLNRASLIILAAVALGGGVVGDGVAYAQPVSPSETVPSQALPPVNRRPEATPPATPTDSNPQPTVAPTPAQPAPMSPAQQIYSPSPSATTRYRAPKPVAEEPAYVLSVKGRVVAAKSKTRSIIVDKDDTINSLAERFLTTKADLLKLNKIKKPQDLNAGQSLKIPTPKAYVVESGDTLFSIAKRFNVSADVLAELNDQDPKGRLRSGDAIALPAGIRDSGSLKKLEEAAPPRRSEGGYGSISRRPETVYGPTTPSGEAAPDTRPRPPVRGETPIPAAPTVPMPSDSAISAAGRGRFIWPVSGQIVSVYGPKPNGQFNQGLDISADQGAPVAAMAEGDVILEGAAAAAPLAALVLTRAERPRPAGVFAEGPQRRLDLGARHIQVRREARERRNRGQNAALLEMCPQRAHLVCGNVHEHDIRLRRLDGETQLAKSGGQVLGVLVIFREAAHVMLERIQARGRQHAGLAHAATERLAPTTRGIDEVARAEQHRAGGSAQTLREANGDRIEPGHGRRLAAAQLHDRIEKPRSIEMSSDPARVHEIGGGAQIRGRQDPAAHRVFQGEQPRPCEMDIRRLDGARDALDRDAAVPLILEGLRLNAAEHGGSPLLVAVGMSVLPDEIFIAAITMRHERRQIALRTGGKEQSARKTEALGQHGLQPVHRGIVPVDIVPDFGGRHGGAHGHGRPGHGVAA